MNSLNIDVPFYSVTLSHKYHNNSCDNTQSHNNSTQEILLYPIDTNDGYSFLELKKITPEIGSINKGQKDSYLFPNILDSYHIYACVYLIPYFASFTFS